jgi:hypothetical protein
MSLHAGDLDDFCSSVLLREIKVYSWPNSRRVSNDQKLQKSQHREKQVVFSCVPAYRRCFPWGSISYFVCISLQLSLRCSFINLTYHLSLKFLLTRSTGRSLIKLDATVTSPLLEGSAVIQISWFNSFNGAILDSCQENLAALSSESVFRARSREVAAAVGFISERTVATTQASYSEGLGFSTPSEGRLAWPMFLVVLFSSSRINVICLVAKL